MLMSIFCNAQKYAFTHYDIEDGLLESQVNSLTLDHEHRLWVATYGGACRFDGKEFISYTRQNGLPTNFVDCVFTDKDDNQWFGTQNGLVKLVNKKLIPVKLPDSLDNRRVRNIVQDGSGNIWAGIGGRLFRVTQDTVKLQWVQDTIKRHLTCVATDESGRLYASIYQKGLYYLDGKHWVKVVDFPANQHSFYVARILFDRNRLFLQTYTSVYTVENGKLQPFEAKAIASISTNSYLLCTTLDADGNLWIGTTIGAYSIRNHQITHFTALNGLTDNAIADVYRDAGNNLWFATQGNGLYRYQGDQFVMLDRSQGMSANEVVMGISKDKKGNILLGIDGGGLMRYDGKNLSSIVLNQRDPELKRIQYLYTDRKGILWIGTHDGLWQYNGEAAERVPELLNYAVNGIIEDYSGTLWITTPSGCFFIKNGETRHVANFYRFSSSIVELGRDSVLVGTNDGVALLVDKQWVKDFKVNALRTSAVFCMMKYKDNIVFGTDDRGIFAWDLHNGEVKNYGLKDGLNSNTIYSLVTDSNGVVWVGTGRGVNRLSFDNEKHLFSVTGSSSKKSLILESNQNAAFYADNKVWIGTTKGAVIYNANSKQDKPAPPYVTIQVARVVPQVGSSNGWLNSTELNDGATLSHDQNHLAIWFRGVDLKDPDNISYSYKLVGLDSTYSAPVTNDVVDYPSLPPGKYTFEVRAISANGALSENTASFSFTITPAFYQTASFRLIGIAFFVLLGFILQIYLQRSKAKRQKIIEATKREESIRIRQQTAEDFHDELGNKLTRITVLSEILGTKMDQDQNDQKKLLEQIRQNASSLYNGTKDILWALDPKSDNLFEILNHIRDFGNELFLDTAIEFEFNGIEESLNKVKLPMEYSRNIPMIFKELLNNTLKHAHATRVIINVDRMQKDELQITLSDNGCGFTKNGSFKGQGINNIITRTKRIGGDIDINSEKGRGTFVELTVRINNTITLN
jgi:ligand-binding sensor domain-containing protein/signal transduction histidine kinase